MSPYPASTAEATVIAAEESVAAARVATAPSARPGRPDLTPSVADHGRKQLTNMTAVHTAHPPAQLASHGVSLLLEDLSRQRLTSGNLTTLITEKYIVGVTTNPSIFQAALTDGASYREQIGELAGRGTDVDATVREVTTDDVRDATDQFSVIYTRTGGVDGRVSREVDPASRTTPPAPSRRRRNCSRSLTGTTC